MFGRATTGGVINTFGAIRALSATVGRGDASVVALSGVYHNLVRRFGDA